MSNVDTPRAIETPFDLKATIINLLGEAEKPMAAKELLRTIKPLTEGTITRKMVNSLLYKMIQTKEVIRLDEKVPRWSINTACINTDCIKAN